jgi:putative membrane protein
MKRNWNLQAIVLIALGLFIYSRIYSGTIFFYINERLATLTLLGATALILVGLTYYLRPPTAAAPCPCGEGEPGHAGHDHHPHTLSWSGLLILSLPLILGLLVTPRPLNTAAMSTREINLGGWNAGLAAGHNGLAIPSPLQRNILDWLQLFQATPEPATLDGQEARVVGFVYREADFAGDTFMVGRFIIIHCVADAAPAGLIVRWPNATDLIDDQWVEVHGRLEAGQFNGRLMPILQAESVALTSAPAQPYLYR